MSLTLTHVLLEVYLYLIKGTISAIPRYQIIGSFRITFRTGTVAYRTVAYRRLKQRSTT